MSNVLNIRKEGQIAYLTMNRPEKRNALSSSLVTALINALREAEMDDEVKAIILSGVGKSFCSGGDIDTMSSFNAPASIVSSMKKSTELTKTIMQLDKYVISAVHGYAAGAGFSLALASDFVIAEKNALFVSSFKNIGLIPDLGLIKLLAERVPLPIAKEWISSAKPISAEEAYSRGIVNRLADDNLLKAATEFAHFIVDGPPVANRFVKYLMNHASEFSHESSIMQENIIQSLLFQTEDTKEGVQAFLEKRRPNFTGK